MYTHLYIVYSFLYMYMYVYIHFYTHFCPNGNHVLHMGSDEGRGVSIIKRGYN